MKTLDKIIFVSEQMKCMHQEEYASLAEKMVTIYNGYDDEDFSFLKNKEKAKKEKGYRIAYAGALHFKRAEGLYFLLRSMYDSGDRLWWHDNLMIDLYSNQITEIDIKDKEFLSFCNKILVRKAALPQKTLFEKLISYDVLFTINDVDNGFAFGTKFFEYLALDKPIMLLSPVGEQYTLLKEKGQYVSDYNTEECVAMLKKLKKDLYSEKLPLPNGLKERFSLDSLTNKLLKIVHNK